MRRPRTILLTLLTVLPLVAVAVQPSSAARVTAAEPIDLLVGDSVMAGMGTDARAALGPHRFDARVCRRLITTSCSYRGSRPSNALSVVQGNAGAYDRAVVVAAGYNDGSIGAAVDAMVAEARRQGIAHVVWLTYRIAGRNAGTYRSHNTTLWTKAAEYPELRIADWASFSAGRSDWVAADGLHLNGSGARAMADLIAATLAGIQPPPTRCDLAANGEPSPDSSSQRITSPPNGLVLHHQPLRLVDTRLREDGKVRAGHMLRVPVPADRRAGTEPVAVTLTAAGPCGPGHLTVFACGTARPATSTLNVDRDGAMANLSIVDVGRDGALCVSTSVTTDVIVDIVGHLAPDGSRIRTFTPTRLFDSRPGFDDELDVTDGVRTAGETTVIPVRRSAAVTDDDVAVVINLTAARPEAAGHLTASPGPCTSPPLASNLNHASGETIAATAISRIGSDGTVCVHHHAATHLVVDLLGTLGVDGSRLSALQNLRLTDSRSGDDHAGEIRLSLADDVPADLTGMVVNAVGIGLEPGFVTVRPCSSTGVPGHSTLNHRTDVRANLALADTGEVCVYRHAPSHVVVDAVAWLRP